MIVIKVWCCLPSDQSEEDLNRLHRAIVKAVVSVSDLCIKDENDMVCLFPSGLIKYGLGQEIIVEVSGLPDIPQKNIIVRQTLARRVGQDVSALYTETRIELSVRGFNSSDGFWTSAKLEDQKT